MNKYAQVAINAIENIKQTQSTPMVAWSQEVDKIFDPNSSGRKKTCPRNTFLGLCSGGVIKDIIPGKYTTAFKTQTYALTAAKLIKHHPEKADNYSKLWKEVLILTENDVNKSHDSQMCIVCVLYKKGYLE